MTYGGDYATAPTDKQYAAIVDTGSSQLSVPPPVFDKLVEKWKEDIPNL